MKKMLALTVAAAMAVGLTACSGSSAGTETEAATEAATQEEAASSEDSAAADGETYTVGICQLVQHDALDAATQGFMDAITDALGEDAVTFDLKWLVIKPF